MREDDVIRLETKIAYQDDLLQQLNEVVIEQQRQLKEMGTSLETITKKLDDLIELAAEERNSSEKPPHY